MSIAGRDAVAYIGLGSNLGDRLSALRAAVQALHVTAGVHVDLKHGVSSVYETSPVDVADSQPAYLNAVVRVHTVLSPRDLLDSLLGIETSLGRVRGAPAAARIIDMDLLLYDELHIHEPGLTIPHPRMHVRRFVLEPMAEIAPGLIHPGQAVNMTELAQQLRISRPFDGVAKFAGADWCA